MNPAEQHQVQDCVILAGGQGSRMGGPKALLKVGTSTLLHRQHQMLTKIFPRVSISLRDRSILSKIDPLPWHDILLDPDPRRCLLDVLGSIISSCAAPVFIAAVDLPMLTPEVVTHICHQHRQGVSVLAVTDQRAQPLAAVWDPSAIQSLEPEDGDLALLAWVRRVPTRLLNWPQDFPDEISSSTRDPFQNLNTPQDLSDLGQSG